MGSSSSSTSTETHTKDTHRHEYLAAMSILPSGARIVAETDQVGCPDGHHQFRLGGTTRIWNRSESVEIQIIFCQGCMTIFKESDICARPCVHKECSSALLAERDENRFLCFMERRHDGPHTCCNCPNRGGMMSRVRMQNLSNPLDYSLVGNDFIAYHKAYRQRQEAISEAEANEEPLPELSDEDLEKLEAKFAAMTPEQRKAKKQALADMNDESNLPKQLVPMNPVIDVARLHEDTAYQISGAMIGNDHEVHDSVTTARHSSYSSGFLGFGASSSYSETTTSNHTSSTSNLYRINTMTATQRDGKFLVDSNQQQAFGRLQSQDGSGRYLTSPASNTSTVIATKPIQQKVYIYEEWQASNQKPCDRGMHKACLIKDAGRKQRFLRHQVFHDCRMTYQQEAELGIRTPMICCRLCGQVTTMLHGYDQSNLTDNPAVQRIISEPGVVTNHFELLINQTAVQGPWGNMENFVGSVVESGTQATRIYSEKRMKTLFPYVNCDEGRHAFGVMFYTTRYESAINELLVKRTRKHYEQYSSSSSFLGIFAISRSSERKEQSHHTSLSVLAWSGSIAVGIFRCSFCTKTTEDPSNALRLLSSSSSLDFRLLGGEAEGGLNNPIIQNYCREVSYSASRHARTTKVYSNSTSYRAESKIPTLEGWLKGLNLEDKGSIFTALNDEEITLNLLISATDNQLASVKAIAFQQESDWNTFITALQKLKVEFADVLD
jgi:hypothetical protein